MDNNFKVGSPGNYKKEHEAYKIEEIAQDTDHVYLMSTVA